jgi:hypothetical protein
MTSRPSRVMTHGPRARTSGPVTRPLTSTRPAAPLCQLWTCRTRAPKSQAHGVRHGIWSRLPRVPTRRALRHPIEPAPRGLRHPQLEPAPHGLRHLKPLVTRVVRGHPTRRASAGGEGPPQTTPLLSVRGCEWGSNPLSSTTLHTPQTSGRGRKL